MFSVTATPQREENNWRNVQNAAASPPPPPPTRAASSVNRLGNLFEAATPPQTENPLKIAVLEYLNNRDNDDLSASEVTVGIRDIKNRLNDGGSIYRLDDADLIKWVAARSSRINGYIQTLRDKIETECRSIHLEADLISENGTLPVFLKIASYIDGSPPAWQKDVAEDLLSSKGFGELKSFLGEGDKFEKLLNLVMYNEVINLLVENPEKGKSLAVPREARAKAFEYLRQDGFQDKILQKIANVKCDGIEQQKVDFVNFLRGNRSKFTELAENVGNHGMLIFIHAKHIISNSNPDLPIVETNKRHVANLLVSSPEILLDKSYLYQTILQCANEVMESVDQSRFSDEGKQDVLVDLNKKLEEYGLFGLQGIIENLCGETFSLTNFKSGIKSLYASTIEGFTIEACKAIVAENHTIETLHCRLRSFSDEFAKSVRPKLECFYAVKCDTVDELHELKHYQATLAGVKNSIQGHDDEFDCAVYKANFIQALKENDIDVERFVQDVPDEEDQNQYLEKLAIAAGQKELDPGVTGLFSDDDSDGDGNGD